jgi:hypothetical protein
VQITAQSFRNDIPRRIRSPRLCLGFFCGFHRTRKPRRRIAPFSPPSSIYKLTKSSRLVQLYDRDPVPMATMSSSPESSSQELSDSPCSSRSASPKPLPLSLQVRDSPSMCAILCAIANSSAMETESRSTSPERTSQQSDAVAQFFVSVPTQGFPTENKQKTQPWRRVWKPQGPTEDEKLIVTCPKICVLTILQSGRVKQ